MNQVSKEEKPASAVMQSPSHPELGPVEERKLTSRPVTQELMVIENDIPVVADPTAVAQNQQQYPGETLVET